LKVEEKVTDHLDTVFLSLMDEFDLSNLSFTALAAIVFETSPLPSLINFL